MVQKMEKKNPVLKKGSGVMSGPTPKSKLIAVKAAEFLGDVIFLSKLAMGIKLITLSVDK